MDPKSENIIIGTGTGVGKKIEVVQTVQIQPGNQQQPQLKMLPPKSQNSGGVSSSVTIIAPSGQTVPRIAAGGVITTTASTPQTKALPTMLKRLPNNISVSAQSIIIQAPEQQQSNPAPATSSFNLIPNQPVIVQPINVESNRKTQPQEQTSLLRQISTRCGDNKVIVERIGERPRTTVVALSATQSAPTAKQIVQVVNPTGASSKKTDDNYIVNAIPSENKAILKLVPTEKQQQTKIVVTGQTIYKPIAPAPPASASPATSKQMQRILPQPAVLKTVPNTGTKLPVQPVASTSISSSSTAAVTKKLMEQPQDSKVDKIFIVRNTQTGSTELVRGKFFNDVLRSDGR